MHLSYRFIFTKNREYIFPIKELNKILNIYMFVAIINIIFVNFLPTSCLLNSFLRTEFFGREEAMTPLIFPEHDLAIKAASKVTYDN